MLRVSDETRDLVQRLAREEFGGASADQVIRRLLDEHWEAAAIAAVQRYRINSPDDWADYVAAADRMSTADATVVDEWSPR